MVFKDNKRPLNDDDSYQLSCKHQRQLDCGSDPASFMETGTCQVLEKPPIPGHETFIRSQHDGRRLSHAVTNALVGKHREFDVSAFGNISGVSWVTSSASEEDSRSRPGLPTSCSPRFVEYDRLARSLVPSEEIYSALIDYPRKLVSLGPDHQADVPEWVLDDTKSSAPVATHTSLDANDAFAESSPSLGTCSHSMLDDSKCEKMIGTCIILIPDASTLADSKDIGRGRADCKCPDMGSVRCVRQHVMEARDELKKTIGQEPFVEWGFCEMGEDVAQRWSEEEEQMFHAVVFSNPASSGKNFWDHLSRVFPTRTKKELVSYYFNVFILRRRAEQNRLDPANIDSDNDEWQGSDDGGEFAMTEEEDEDSAVESPANQEHVVHNGDDVHEDCHEDDEDEDGDYEINNDGADADVDDDAVMSDDDDDDDDDGGLDDVSGPHVGNVMSLGKDDCSSVLVNKNADGNPQNGAEDQDVQDDSCTSYECQRNGVDSYGPSDVVATEESQIEGGHNKSSHGEFGNDILSGLVDQYILESPCEAKAWDIGFLPGPEKDVDFLSTYNMIEEVFGDEARSKNETSDDAHKS